MSIRIVCPNCRTAYNAAHDQRGRRVRCKNCQAIFLAVGPEDRANSFSGDLACGEKVVASAQQTATADSRKAAENSSPSRRRRKRKWPKIPPFALFLILGGVGGSLLIVAGSLVFCIWLWMNPPDTWRNSKPAPAAFRFPVGPNFRIQAPNVHMDQAADGDGKAMVGQEPEADPALPLPPREFDLTTLRPVEPKRTQLVFRQQIGRWTLVLDSQLEFNVTGPHGVEHSRAAWAQTRVTETIEAVDAQELASVRLQYRAHNVKLRGDNQEVPTPPAITQARQNIKRLAANLRIRSKRQLGG